MPYRRLYILVEGDSDELFFDVVAKPLLMRIYDHVELWRYAERQSKVVSKLLTSIECMNADYIFTADIDQSPCITGKKAEIQARFSRLDGDRILIVVKEIEGWYLAGLDDIHCKKHELPVLSVTDSLTKEDFRSHIPDKFRSRIDFFQEVLKCFRADVAEQKNSSFAYFVRKFCPHTAQ